MPKYSSEWWRHKHGLLTPWEGGPAWKDHERWPWQVAADADKDALFALNGPAPGGLPVR